MRAWFSTHEPESIDHLVISGSKSVHGPFRELETEPVRAMFDSKFWGPYVAAREAMADQGMPDWAIDWMLSLYAATRDGALAEPTDTVQRVTGQPPRTFAQFARDYAQGWR